MDAFVSIPLILLLVLIVLVVAVVFKSVIMVHQGYKVIVERLGKYHKTLDPGLHFLVPFFDSVRQRIDTREQVVPFRPQTVITADNINVSIDTVIYYQVVSPEAATYEIANPMLAIEQLAVTTMRNIIGKMDMEQALTGRDTINGQLRGELDEATGRWGIRVTRVELKAIDPPATVQAAMEQQMKAERDRRAKVLEAEGVKQSQILTAEGEKQSQILRAEGEAQSAKLRAAGESAAILQVFDAIHKGNADPKLLSYEYIKMLPEIAKSESSKMWIVPTELTSALSAVSRGFGGTGEDSSVDFSPSTINMGDEPLEKVELPDLADALAEAKESVTQSEETVGATNPALPLDAYEEAGQAPTRPVVVNPDTPEGQGI
ncbi:MAG: SPFH/Band 7/PHB domain protein [Actinomycetaceae bacterium]|nr:SPFH/Band 7/PHB domain protein [Actinomycetaceae bacterium]